MVRVISVHHFNGQDVETCPKPCSSVVTKSHLLIASSEKKSQIVEVRELKKSGAKLSHSFSTIDQVSFLVYSPIGDYVAALEGGKNTRVYVNWFDPKVETAPSRPRIANAVTPTLNFDEVVALDIIEFPIIKNCTPMAISVCSSTGNLMIASSPSIIVIYRFLVKEANKKNSYIDFEECIHVFHSFIPKEIAICEDVIGCLSSTEFHAFKVKIRDITDERRMRSMSMYSFTSESESVGSSPRSPSSSSSAAAESEASSSKRKVNITLKKQQDSEANETQLEGYGGNVHRHPNHVNISQFDEKVVIPEIEAANKEYLSIGTPKIMDQMLGPAANHQNTSIKVVCNLCEDREFEAECVTLLYCKMLKSEEIHETFQNLHIKPVYWREFKVRKSTKPTNFPPHFQHPLQSLFYPHLMSFTTCFTSLNEGYLYHLPGHLRKAGKGVGVQRIATYPFTSPVCKIALEPTLMHAITETGLETYTLRSGYYTVMEAENINGVTNACPGGDIPICLVGLRPFPGVKHLNVSSSHLVLLSSPNDSAAMDNDNDSSRWTLYSLTLPSHFDVYKDMLQLADMNKTNSPQGYSQLLCEAHMVLRTSYHKLSWELAIKGNNNSCTEILAKTKDLYQDSCLRLAHYYVLSKDPKEWKNALPYYRLSSKPVSLILNEAVKLWEEAKKEDKLPQGLIHYISEFILRPKSPLEDVLDASLADQIIQILGKHALDKLATIVLKSASFRSFKTKQMYEYFKKHLRSSSKPNAEEVLAFALLCVDRGSAEEEEEARGLIRSLSNVALSEILIEHHGFLLDSDSFSDLALLIRDSVPEIFVEVLVSLIKVEILSLPVILNLFIGNCVSLTNANNSAILQLFLETYFIELLDSSSPSPPLNEFQEQALITLIRSYLSCLSVPIRFGQKNIDSDMYESRFAYLDSLPPFQNGGSKETLLDAESPDFWCQNSLLKLQSLLCCSQLISVDDTTNVNDTIFAFLERYPDTVGSVSLKVLCSSNEVSIPLLAKEYPNALLPFGKDKIKENREWKLVLESLQDHLSNDPDQTMHEEWYSAMQEVLDHLAQTLSLESFLQILPHAMQNNEDYQGYIQMCRKIQQANQLQNLIAATGQQLLSTLTL